MKLRRFFVHPVKAYLIPALIGALVCFITMSGHGFDLPIYYADAFSVAGTVVLLIGCLWLMAFLGSFDTLTYGASYIRGHRYKDMYDYTQSKQESRSRLPWRFAPFITVGLIYLLAGLILSLLIVV